MSKKQRLKPKKATTEVADGHEPKDKSQFVYQRDKLENPLAIRYPYEITPKQQQLLDILLDKESKIIFISGPAGTGKTLLATYAGLTLLNSKRMSDIVFVRSLVESSSKSMGYLKGSIEEKFGPYAGPLNDKLSELLPKKDIEYLTNGQRITNLPINFARGSSFNVKYILGDEMQNLDTAELLTLLTRLGKFSKLVLCGDADQSDIGRKSGFMKFFDLFNDEPSRDRGIHCFSFTREDIVRNGLLKYVIERYETMPR